MVLSKALVPKVILLLEEHKLAPRTRDDMVSLLTAVGQIADDPEAAKSLLQMLLRAEIRLSLCTRGYYYVLYNICQRARARAYPDGRSHA